MKKFGTSILLLLCMLVLAGCTISGTEADYPAAIMVRGNIYFLTSAAPETAVDESAIIGYTTSYTDTFPQKDGETNFNRDLEMPYAEAGDGIAVLYNNEWLLCIPEDLARPGT